MRASALFFLIMLTFYISGVRAGLRGKSFLGVFVLGLLLIGIAFLTGYFSPRQPKTVALDVGLSFLRLILVFLSLFWVQDLISKEIERRTVMFSLAYPVPRAHYLLGRYLAIQTMSVLVALGMAVLLWGAVALAGGSYEQQFPVNLGWPYWIALSGIVLDAAVVSAFALWIATVSTTPMLPLAAGLIFAAVGKSLGAVMDFLARGADGDAALAARFDPIIGLIRWILPDLSRLDWRAAALYNQPMDGTLMGWSICMALAYAGIMLLAATLSFSRREFF
ncbi:ABC-type transport system involved in multi-copper enzyme maturation, permease component [Chitinimonas taiwanensis DSM 18899]|uniref:ABC-type transport system involved in multi-copper enzyme maturation, permease component n=1 Tax=Chitinimonas taiwanensis DSM 18899 TaxID=1121279 RepID=A0A1K2HCP8_9NEIS|nr:ABC-type transport system involved in multi-copper enzyme maturation, permease component [Chitinimonas taiwanensis DSM 18899]